MKWISIKDKFPTTKRYIDIILTDGSRVVTCIYNKYDKTVYDGYIYYSLGEFTHWIEVEFPKVEE